jgi:branched-chain amino acid aminotransferase
MPANTYRLDPDGSLHLTHLTGSHLDNVSMLLPDGIYTTLRTYAGDRIVGLSAHLQRLVESHAKLDRLRPLDLAAIRAGLREVLRREAGPALRLRITTPFDSPEVYISVEPFSPHPAEFYTHGVRCLTSHLERSTPEAKHTSFIAPSRSEKAQAAPDIHEALMVNRQGEILEGFSSNFYAVLDGVLRTAGAGVLAGITRAVTLAAAEGLAPVSLTPVHVADLKAVTEAFITSSAREVMPVRQIDDVVIGEPGPVTRALMARYRERILTDAEQP